MPGTKVNSVGGNEETAEKPENFWAQFPMELDWIPGRPMDKLVDSGFGNRSLGIVLALNPGRFVDEHGRLAIALAFIACLVASIASWTTLVLKFEIILVSKSVKDQELMSYHI